ELEAYLAAGGLDALQEEYSMIKREIETTLLPACRQHNIAMLSYSSLALGLLSGRIGPDRVFQGDDLRRENPRVSLANPPKDEALTRDIAPGVAGHGP